ncbi:MAG: haloacid dehalogenase type II, partial [Gammaproteobacteria bacterium]|nr:haloacid dehalogenase type II [Gammaproteobacteria bacterium]
IKSIWVKRAAQQQMDTWGARPVHTITSLSQLEALF